MLKPKTSFRSVVDELVVGLEDGSIVLPPEESEHQAVGRLQAEERIQRAVTDILRELESCRNKALEEAARLPQEPRDRLIDVIEARISTVRIRIGELEQDAYRAIQQDSPTLLMDTSAQMARTVTSGIKELADTVSAAVDDKPQFVSWLLLLGGGIAGASAFSFAISKALSQKGGKKGDTPD